MIKTLLLNILFLTNVYSFITYPSLRSLSFKRCYTMQLSDNSGDYLDSINKKHIDKLENVKTKIIKYINQQKDENKLEKGYNPCFNPIKRVSFDTIFLNILNVKTIYMSNNSDRLIFEHHNGFRCVYYINNKEELIKINQLIKLIPHSIKTIIICDIHNVMDDMFGHLYCEPNKNDTIDNDFIC